MFIGAALSGDGSCRRAANGRAAEGFRPGSIHAGACCGQGAVGAFSALVIEKFAQTAIFLKCALFRLTTYPLHSPVITARGGLATMVVR